MVRHKKDLDYPPDDTMRFGEGDRVRLWDITLTRPGSLFLPPLPPHARAPLHRLLSHSPHSYRDSRSRRRMGRDEFGTVALRGTGGMRRSELRDIVLRGVHGRHNRVVDYEISTRAVSTRLQIR